MLRCSGFYLQSLDPINSIDVPYRRIDPLVQASSNQIARGVARFRIWPAGQ
jgi:hypothetical protein